MSVESHLDLETSYEDVLAWHHTAHQTQFIMLWSPPLFVFFLFFVTRVDSGGSLSRREQKRAQYQHVKAHMQKEDGRVTAHGWSLPGKCKARDLHLDRSIICPQRGNLIVYNHKQVVIFVLKFILFFKNLFYETHFIYLFIYCKISIIELLSFS